MSQALPEDKQKLVEQVCETCHVEEQAASHYLEAYDWNAQAAIEGFMADNFDSADQPAEPAPEPAYTGPRTLDGRPAPVESRPAAAARPPQRTVVKKKGVATLGSLAQASHADDDDENGDDLNKENRGNLFAGGEKSGLAIQDPSRDGREGGSRGLIHDILAKAKSNATRNEAETGPSTSSRFRGTGMTLGGDGQESRSIEDPYAQQANTPVQERVLHIWSNGFSIDDGELRRYDDPANHADLEMIRRGRAPLHLMNVRPDQPVNVRVLDHKTDYVPPPKTYTPFAGSGHRLGSPVPGAGSSAPTAAVASTPTTTIQSSGGAASSTLAGPTVDDSQPVVTIRIQLPDGRRMPVQFNTSHTVGDMYNALQNASAEMGSRPWTLVTTFPNKDHKDKSLALADVPEFKKGGTAVVKWT